MEKKTNTPALRFRGFDRPWEKKKLGTIVTFNNGRAYAQDELLNQGKYKVLRVGNFYTNDSWYYSNLELGNKYYADNGDLLYTWSATFGPHIWNGEKVIYHYHIWKLDLSDQLDKLFALQLLERDKQSLLTETNGSTMIHITKSGMEQREVTIAKNVKEQEKIGAFCLKLDEMFSVQERKIKKLEQFRQAMLTKLFPAEGASEPALRFRGFSSPWKRCELGSIADFNPKCELPERFEYVDLESVVGTQIIAHRTETKSTAPSRAQRLAQKGDIFYQTVRPYQKNNCLFDSDDQNYVFSSGYAQLRPHGDSSFLLALMQTDIFVNEVLNHCTGTSFPAVSSNDLAGIIVTFPASFDEQKKIGDFFHRLDLYISLQKEKLDKMHLLKAALLDRLFV